MFLAVPGGRPALAHAVVVAAEPAAGSQIAEPAQHYIVRFNSRIDHARSRLVLIGPDGASRALLPDPAEAPTALAARLPPGTALPPGAWRLRWQVLAIDGHITRGDIPFTLRAR